MSKHLVLLVAVAVACLLVGCKPAPGPSGPSPLPPATKAATPPPAESAKLATAESETKAAPEAKAAPPASTGPSAWTETPSLDKVPSDGVKGVLNGKPFEAKSVILDCQGGKFTRIEFSDKKMEGDSDLLTEDTEVGVTLPSEATAGLKLDKKMGDAAPGESHAYYKYPLADGTPSSVNCPWACALVLDACERKPYDPAGKWAQTAGTCRGRILICFKDDVNSWIAGTFEGKLRYFGQP